MGIKVETRGFPELERDLKALGPAVTQFKVLGSALRSALRPVKAAAEALVPVDTGFLRESIRLRVFRPRGSLPAAGAVGVFWKTRARGAQKLLQPYYAQFIERGTRHAAARPFLRPAFDRNVETMTQRFRDALGAAIDRAVRKRGV